MPGFEAADGDRGPELAFDLRLLEGQPPGRFHQAAGGDWFADQVVHRIVERVRARVDLVDEPLVVLARHLVEHVEELLRLRMLELGAREEYRQHLLHRFPRVHALERVQHQRRLVVRQVLVRRRPQRGGRRRDRIPIGRATVGVHVIGIGGALQPDVAVLPRDEVAEEALHQVVRLERFPLHARVGVLVDAFIEPREMDLVVGDEAVPELVAHFVDDHVFRIVAVARRQPARSTREDGRILHPLRLALIRRIDDRQLRIRVGAEPFAVIFQRRGRGGEVALGEVFVLGLD